MTSAELFTIMPWLILAGTAVVVMVEIAFYRDHLLTAALTTAGLVAAWIALVSGATAEPLQITPLLFVDGYARFFMGLMIAATLVVVLLSYSFFWRNRGPAGRALCVVAAGDPGLDGVGGEQSFRIVLSRLGSSQRLSLRVDRLSA
jgi:NADH:ubiquinone oxidoreductase subunit 2 (subunit N)